MQLRRFIADDEAMSPVIGVTLVVAMTIILAAVIGTFVLGLGENLQESPPQTNFDYRYGSGGYTLLITHDGGETFEASAVNATIEGVAGDEAPGDTSTSNETLYYRGDLFGSSGTVSAGDSAAIGGDDLVDDDGNFHTFNTYYSFSEATVRIVWAAPSGTSSNTIGVWTGPDA